MSEEDTLNQAYLELEAGLKRRTSGLSKWLIKYDDNKRRISRGALEITVRLAPGGKAAEFGLLLNQEAFQYTSRGDSADAAIAFFLQDPNNPLINS